jgi:hypothetical protein
MSKQDGMTATDRAKELIEVDRTCHGWYCRPECIIEICEALLSAEAKVEKYQARLEITHDYDGHTGEKREIPPEKRDTYPDGIFCRDATIKLLKGEIEDYRAKVAALAELVYGVLASLDCECDEYHGYRCSIHEWREEFARIMGAEETE